MISNDKETEMSYNNCLNLLMTVLVNLSQRRKEKDEIKKRHQFSDLLERYFFFEPFFFLTDPTKMKRLLKGEGVVQARTNI